MLFTKPNHVLWCFLCLLHCYCPHHGHPALLLPQVIGIAFVMWCHLLTSLDPFPPLETVFSWNVLFFTEFVAYGFYILYPCRMPGMLEGKRWQGEPQKNHRTTGEWWWAVAGAFLDPYQQGCWVAGLWVQLNEKEWGGNHDMVILEVKWQEGTESRTQLEALVSSEKGALRYNNVRIMGRCRQSKNDHLSYFV